MLYGYPRHEILPLTTFDSPLQILAQPVRGDIQLILKLQKIHFNYQIASLIVERQPFDMYLVDGRYRVACACLSLLHAMSRGGDM